MSSCLGIYIESDIIKYVKISKEQENYKIESFGMKFYDDIKSAIKEIIAETYSFNVKISINLSDEMYNYFEAFSLLTKKDISSALELEFELYCNEKAIEYNLQESRYFLIKDTENREKSTAIYISAKKTEIAKNNSYFEGQKLAFILPLPVCLKNLLDIPSKTNIIIVNLEERTTLTTIINGEITKIDILENNVHEILTKIEKKEKSITKAYEIYKNSIIYTQEGKNLQIEENLYLADIMPILYNIIQEIQSIREDRLDKIDKIYLTGTGILINNIDLYFQEYFPDSECSILTPKIIQNIPTKINIKDYIEVNSAISLAMTCLDNEKDLSFKKITILEKVKNLKKEKKASNNKEKKKIFKLPNIKMNFNESLDFLEIILLRFSFAIIILIILYSVFMSILKKNILEIESDIIQYETYIKGINAKVDADKQKIIDKTNNYSSLISSLEQENTQVVEVYRNKKAIPNLLTQLRVVIPKTVQIKSIENTTEEKIKIVAVSSKYEQLAYFIGKLKTAEILLNITTSTGTISNADTQNASIEITIEGNLK